MVLSAYVHSGSYKNKGKSQKSLPYLKHSLLFCRNSGGRTRWSQGGRNGDIRVVQVLVP